jgi:hypothetical protein
VEKWSDRRRFLEEAWGGTNGGINRGNKGKFLGNIQERVRSWFLDQLGREVGLCSEGTQPQRIRSCNTENDQGRIRSCNTENDQGRIRSCNIEIRCWC